MRSNQAPDRLSIFKNHQRRDGLNTQMTGSIGVLIDIHFGKFELPLVLVAQALKDRCNRATRTTPTSPEVHNHRYIRLGHVGCKILIANIKQIGMCIHYLLHSLSDENGFLSFVKEGQYE